jgi:membrane-associated phospholipid phosphatase
MQITAFCGAMLLVLDRGTSRRFRAAATGVAVTAVTLVGTSRVYLGVHWMTDVLGGLALSSAFVCLVAATAGLLTRHRGDPNRDSSQRPRPNWSRRSQRRAPATHTTR